MVSPDYKTYVNALIHCIDIHEKFNQDFKKFYGKIEEVEAELYKKINELTEVMNSKDELDDEILKMDEECRNILSDEDVSKINNKTYEFREKYEYLKGMKDKVEYLREVNKIEKDENVIENLEKYLDEEKYLERMKDKDDIYLLIDELDILSESVEFGILEFDLSVDFFNIKEYGLLNFDDMDSEYISKK